MVRFLKNNNFVMFANKLLEKSVQINSIWYYLKVESNTSEFTTYTSNCSV